MEFNLGLDQDLINAVSQIVEASCASKKMEKEEASCSSKKMEKEELHPNQKKLDKNKNGKLDAQDFKMLRKEDAEELDELSKTTLGSYVKKAGQHRVNLAGKEKELGDTVNKLQKAKNDMDDDNYSKVSDVQDIVSKQRNAVSDKGVARARGIHTAIKKLTKEQVEEIEALAAKHGLGE